MIFDKVELFGIQIQSQLFEYLNSICLLKSNEYKYVQIALFVTNYLNIQIIQIIRPNTVSFLRVCYHNFLFRFSLYTCHWFNVNLWINIPTSVLTVTPKIASGFFKILFAAWRMFEIHHTHESVMGENFDWWKIWG